MFFIPQKPKRFLKFAQKETIDWQSSKGISLCAVWAISIFISERSLYYHWYRLDRRFYRFWVASGKRDTCGYLNKTSCLSSRSFVLGIAKDVSYISHPHTGCVTWVPWLPPFFLPGISFDGAV